MVTTLRIKVPAESDARVSTLERDRRRRIPKRRANPFFGTERMHHERRRVEVKAPGTQRIRPVSFALPKMIQPENSRLKSTGDEMTGNLWKES